jgi:hypothetical protein
VAVVAAMLHIAELSCVQTHVAVLACVHMQHAHRVTVGIAAANICCCCQLCCLPPVGVTWATALATALLLGTSMSRGTAGAAG